MVILSCNSISKTFAINKILENISFTIEAGDKIGLIGLNGSGKTTLFNILAGDIPNDEGHIYIRKDLRVGYLRQHTEVYSSKTIIEECTDVFKHLIDMEEDLRNLEHKISLEATKNKTDGLAQMMDDYSFLLDEFNNKNGYGYKSEIKGVLKGLGFDEDDFDKEINLLSGGQKARLSLAKLLLEEPDLLLLDEPTNHLDIEAINWLEAYISDYEGTAIVISHDRYFLDNIVNKVFHLENMKLRSYNANYSKFMEERKREIELEKKSYENQQKEIKRQEEIIERFMNYGDRRYIRQAQSRQKLLDKMKVLDRPMDIKKVNINFTPMIKSGNDVLFVENLCKSFGEFRLLDNVNFTVYRGEKVGLIGPNGIGKTTIFKMILDHLPYDSGNVMLGHQVNVGYFDQEQAELNMHNTIMDEIWDQNPSFNHYQIRTMLSKFLFIGDDIFREISELSGGERGRLALLKLMLSKANFLLMDEPTNHLDIYSKEVLEDAINSYEGTLLVISHDRYFLNRIANKILELSEDGITEYLGNFDYYLQKKNEIVIEDDEQYATKTQVKLEKRKQKAKIAAEKRKNEEVLTLEGIIGNKEKELAEIDNLLCKPELYENPDRILELNSDRMNLQLELDSLYDKWFKLTDN